MLYCSRWSRAVEQWRKFHCDMKDLSSWLSEAENKLTDTRNQNGDLLVSAARNVQKVSKPRSFVNIIVYDN